MSLKIIICKEDIECPLSIDQMIDPVICVGDGHAYEQSEIYEWLSGNNNSPMTRKKLKNRERYLVRVGALNDCVKSATTIRSTDDIIKDTNNANHELLEEVAPSDVPNGVPDDTVDDTVDDVPDDTIDDINL